jgi:hypothetical protein
VKPGATVQCLIGRASILKGDAEHTVECAERVKPTIESKNIFIHISLEVILANAMVGSEEPGVQITEH